MLAAENKHLPGAADAKLFMPSSYERDDDNGYTALGREILSQHTTDVRMEEEKLFDCLHMKSHILYILRPRAIPLN